MREGEGCILPPPALVSSSTRSGFALACQQVPVGEDPICTQAPWRAMRCLLYRSESTTNADFSPQNADLLTCRRALILRWVVGMWIPDCPLSGLCYLIGDKRILVSDL